MGLNQYQRAKLNKILIIVAISLFVIAIIVSILFIILRNSKNQEEKDYTDTIVGKNLFNVISIDTHTKEVTRDGKETTLKEEFDLDELQEELLLSDTQELINYFADSTIEVDTKDNAINLTNKYQTKTLFIEAEEIKDSFDGQVVQIQDNLYMLKYDTQKKTKAAHEFLQFESYIKTIELDEVSIIKPINDESQTVYDETTENDNNGSARNFCNGNR